LASLKLALIENCKEGKMENAPLVENADCQKPFVKWVGGKGQLLKTFDEMFPRELLNGEIETYVEPFVGGGAVLFHILQNYKIKRAYINDINAELINCYRCIKADAKRTIAMLKKTKEEYLSSEDRANYFYKVRNHYNTTKLNEICDFEKCADFIFLNKTCFNGLYRVNRKGEFNVPHGKYKNPTICDEENLLSVSRALQKVEIHCGDYTLTESFIDKNSFVYLDPPYRPISETSAFTSYNSHGFDDAEQIRLSKFIDKMNERGAKIVLSNSDPKNANPDDNFFDDLYKAYKIGRVSASRMINSKAGGRGKIKELLVCN